MRAKMIVSVLLMAVLVRSNAICGWVECELLQSRLDRLYFSVGSETYVFPGSRYRAICADDTLAIGYIEAAMLGACHTVPLESQEVADMDILSSLRSDSCRILVETADVDSSIDIRLGSSCWSGSEIILMTPGGVPDSSGQGETIRTETGAGNPLYLEFRSRSSYEKDHASLDGLLGCTSASESTEQRLMSAGRAPFLAVLLPNLSDDGNRGGVLTTALYYRFGEQVVAHMFDGDEVIVVTSLVADYTDHPRAYPLAPERGQALLREQRNRPKGIDIGYDGRNLRGVAAYFADVLSRDRVHAELVGDDPEADLFISWVPVCGAEPEQALRHVLNMLSRHEPRTRAQREALAIASGHISSAEVTPDPVARLRYCRLAERVMIHDLGVFPLFRPSLYLHASPMLRGGRFDSDGRLDLSSLVKLVLPRSDNGEGR